MKIQFILTFFILIINISVYILIVFLSFSSQALWSKAKRNFPFKYFTFWKEPLMGIRLTWTLKIFKKMEIVIESPISSSLTFSILIILPSAGDRIIFLLLGIVLLGSLKKFKQNRKNRLHINGNKIFILYTTFR